MLNFDFPHPATPVFVQGRDFYKLKSFTIFVINKDIDSAMFLKNILKRTHILWLYSF